MVFNEKRLERYGKIRAYVEIACDTCKKHFYKRKSFYEGSKKNFCSSLCLRNFTSHVVRKGNLPTEKICSWCNVSKDKSLFYQRRDSLDGLTGTCKDCIKIKQKTTYKDKIDERRRRNFTRKKALSRERRLLNVYGITSADYHSMLDAQGGVCAICKSPESKSKNGNTILLSVDHCHKTGKIRGILCNRCNTSLGKFEDSIEILQSCIDYLLKYKNS